MKDCVFCRIIEGSIPSQRLYEDDEIIAIQDANPQAPIHCLIIPKQHLPTALDFQSSHREMIGNIYLVAKKLAEENEVAEQGYRVVLNCNRDAGQTVFHVHFHFLAGRILGWPPG